MFYSPSIRHAARRPTGAKLALKPFHVWGIRVRLQVSQRARDLALFDLALDSKLRGCDLLRLRVSDLLSSNGVKRRVMVVQQKTGRPVQFEVTEQSRRSIALWVESKRLGPDDWLFPSRMKRGCHLSTRQYARLVDKWVSLVGLDPPPTALTACAERRLRCFTRRPGTCEPANCSSAIPSSRVPSGISASR